MSARAERVLERIRAIPPGFVRSYGDVSPGAPRFAGTVLSETDDPGVPWFRVVRADGSLAKGARQRALLDAEGVPFRGDRVDMRVARLPELMWLQREITLRARPRGFHLVTRRGRRGAPGARELRVGLAHLFIRHTSASLTLNENASPRRAPRLRDVVLRARSRRAWPGSTRWRAPTTCRRTSRPRCWARR